MLWMVTTVDDMIKNIHFHEAFLSQNLTINRSIFGVQGRLRHSNIYIHLLYLTHAPTQSHNETKTSRCSDTFNTVFKYRDFLSVFSSTGTPEIFRSWAVFRHKTPDWYGFWDNILSTTVVNELMNQHVTRSRFDVFHKILIYIFQTDND